MFDRNKKQSFRLLGAYQETKGLGLGERRIHLTRTLMVMVGGGRHRKCGSTMQDAG